MSFIEIKNVQISGVVTCVPATIVKNQSSNIFSTKEECEKFISITGVSEKRHAENDVCTSDSCFKAATHLLNILNWEKSEIDFLIFVSQTPDYLAPNTSIILQDRLGLSKKCASFDIPLGCSGYVYGLSIISSLISSSNFGKGILLVGDTLSRQCSASDKSTYPLFGDAASATGIEFKHNVSIKFSLWSDGSGYKSIYVPDGGYRSPFSSDSLTNHTDEKGNIRSNLNTFMNGTDVFGFGISEVPKVFNDFIEHYNINSSSIDFFIFHQANKYMNELIRKKLKIPLHKYPYSIEKYGNTSSATIPLTMSVVKWNLSGSSILLCGFGVGLSIGILQTILPVNFLNEFIEYE